MGLNIDLSGRTALVTGASRGIGRAIALALGKAGADVAVTDLLVENDELTTEQAAEHGLLAAHFTAENQVHTTATAITIREFGVRSIALRMDVAEPFEIEKVVHEITDKWGGIDILVNNAAVMENFGLLKRQTPDAFTKDIQVNLTGAFHCSKAVWPEMMEKGWGRIINISSIAALHGAFAMPGYGASKAGLLGLTRSLAIEGAANNITVNAVLPGPIETEALKLHKPEYIQRMKDRTPMKRLGRPDDVAAVVAFLASDLSGFITGAGIPVTGGVELFGI